MDYFLRLEHPLLAVLSLLCVGIAILIRWKWQQRIVFKFSLTGEIAQTQKGSHSRVQQLFYSIRIALFVSLAILVGKPQIVDSRSNIVVDGIDIILSLDASGSMQHQDCSDDGRTRFQVAKDEATRFISKRPNDAIGLVLFGAASLCRCPLTMDKHIISDVIEKLALGDIDPDGTVLSRGLITAINRLKKSKAKSKIIILLTDGEPSDGDAHPDAAIKIAQKFGIKVYTIGIGSEEGERGFHPFFGGLFQMPRVNVPLLKKIAHETGGTFFMARNDKEMRTIYDTIDKLERTQHESPLYSRYFDIYSWITIGILLLLLLEQILLSMVWFTI